MRRCSGIRVVPRVSHWEPFHEKALLREVRARLGHEIEVTIEPVRHIPREPNGKLRAVKSRIGRLSA